MSKYIVIVDIPDDYAEDYSQWEIEGELRYLEDGAWTHFKDVEAILKPNDKAIPIEWITDWLTKQSIPATSYGIDYSAVEKMLADWEKENEAD